MPTNRQILLAARPEGEPQPKHFRLAETPSPEPGDGEVLLRTLWLSLDPYMRGRMSAARSYARPVEVGEVMEGGTVSKVVASRRKEFAPGDIVLARAGWQDYAVSDGSGLRKLDPAREAGETVAVAAATGPVGATVGQIAKLKGCRAVGIAGGPDKCRYLIDQLGFDAAVDHRTSDFANKLRLACPRGIDVYFENVGGAVWEAVVPQLNDFARVPVCGLIAHYNDAALPAGPDLTPQLMRAVLTKRLTIRGFIVRDFAAHAGEFERDVGQWVREGKIKYKEDVVEGLENAPQAFIGLLRGKNFGKLLVRVAQE